MQSTACLSFLSGAEKLTLLAYTTLSTRSLLASEIASRVVSLFLSPAAALDMGYHTLFILPTFTYALGKSIYRWRMDFTLPWQHIQQVRNAVAPLLLGTAFALLHPFAGLAVSEPTDKHIVIGMLGSHVGAGIETPCSPIHSLSLIEKLALKHRYFEDNGVQKEIFSAEHLKLIREIKEWEWSLEVLQAQEYIQKITNVTLVVMHLIADWISKSKIGTLNQEICIRLAAVVLIPVLTALDLIIASVVQVFFLVTGTVRLISGRGPIYTEVTTNPVMHLFFLMQNILKTVGNCIGTLVWLVSVETGFRVSLLPAHALFNMQMRLLMLSVRIKMYFAKEGSRFGLPIVFGNGPCSALSVPTHSMHKTYLIVEKQNQHFNLYWVNRPRVSLKRGLDTAAALTQISDMFEERFPFMNMDKVLNYPITSKPPEFWGAKDFAEIERQGTDTNCVVSNLFGTLETLDKIRREEEVTPCRYKAVREILMKDYAFYQESFSPFSPKSSYYSFGYIWGILNGYLTKAI